ncbi:MAG: hypothetical protein OXF27_18140 [Acidobacteria bacterium]|nr:hypothetical protein [Acidobacteriota bacterium]
MIKVVSWNISKRVKPWREMVRMAREGDADVALVQEAGSPPGDLVPPIEYEDRVFWSRHLYDRWPLVVALSDRVRVEPYRQVPPISDLAADAIGVSGIGTIAAARIVPRESEEDAFVAVSMYARWIKPHPSTKSSWGVGCSDVSAHRIISDLSAFIGHEDPSRHRILAAGDLNLIYGATRDNRLVLFDRDNTVWHRMDKLGMEFMGPQHPHGGRRAEPRPAGLPADTHNVPTYYTSRQGSADAAQNQLDYAFASRGFHESVSVRAMNNDAVEWGASDHCRLMIEVRTKADCA